MSQHYQIPPGEVEYRNAVYDARGAEAMQQPRYVEIVTIGPDGQSRLFKNTEHVALADGRLVTSAMLGMGKVELAVCDLCRYPLAPSWFGEAEVPSLGVMLRESGDFCTGCSQFVCRRHARIGSDGFTRCVRCAQQFGWRRFVHSLFFAPMDDAP